MSNFTKVNPEFAKIVNEGGFMAPLTEAYFGRSKELKQIEQEFDKIIKIVRKVYAGGDDVTGFHQMLQKIIRSKDCKDCIIKIEKLFMKQFGFREFNLLFPQAMSAIGPNAMTPINGIIRRIVASDGMLNFVPLKQASGGYYDKTHTYTCTVLVTPGIFDIKDITGGEITGLVLHEIGHNFQCAPMANLAVALPFLELFEINFDAGKAANVANSPALVKILNYVINTELGAEVMNITTRFNNWIYELFSEILKPVIEITDTIGKILSYWGALATQMIPGLLPGAMAGMSIKAIMNATPATILATLANYSGEVFADSFATAYGYGPDLSSALNKLGNNMLMDYNLLLDSPLGPIYEVNVITFEIISDIFCLDPHPSMQRRILNNIEKLEREIQSSDLPPSLKKSALADLKKNRRVYDKFLKGEVGTKQYAYIASYRTLNDKVFGGKLDIKHTLNKIANLGHYEA